MFIVFPPRIWKRTQHPKACVYFTFSRKNIFHCVTLSVKKMTTILNVPTGEVFPPKNSDSFQLKVTSDIFGVWMIHLYSGIIFVRTCAVFFSKALIWKWFNWKKRAFFNYWPKHTKWNTQYEVKYQRFSLQNKEKDIMSLFLKISFINLKGYVDDLLSTDSVSLTSMPNLRGAISLTHVLVDPSFSWRGVWVGSSKLPRLQTSASTFCQQSAK